MDVAGYDCVREELGAQRGDADGHGIAKIPTNDAAQTGRMIRVALDGLRYCPGA